jgi:hypothetical protein
MNIQTKEDKLAKTQEYSKPMVSDLGKLADETKGGASGIPDTTNLGVTVGSL